MSKTSMVSNTPNAKILINSLRHVGYENVSAINDIVDNGFDAGASKIKVDLLSFDSGKYGIVIADNGKGMGFGTLDEALKLGSISDKSANTDLGKFGMGLITASISMARRLKVITKKENDVYYTGVQDIDVIIETNSFVKELRESTLEEINLFHEMLGDEAVNGTIVLLSKCDGLKKPKKLVADIKMDMSRVFRKFIDNGKEIYVNDIKLASIDPLMMENGAIVIQDVVMPIKLGDKTSDITVKIVRLPDLSKVVSNQLDLELSLKNQGFYVLRNGREILSGSSLNLFSKHSGYNRIRAELNFNAELDEKMGVNFTKKNFDMSDDIIVELEEKVKPILATLKRQLENENKVQESGDVNHGESVREITKKKGFLTHPVGEVPKERRTRRPNTEEPTTTTGEPVEGRTRTPRVTQERFSNAKVDVEFGTKSMSKAGPIYDWTIEKNKLFIYYNVDHPFYQKFVLDQKRNQDAINAVDFLIYSSVAAEVDSSTSEENGLLFENYKEKISSNMRTLLM